MSEIVHSDHESPRNQHSMDELTHRISSLSPAKRALLELRLKKDSAASTEQTIPRRTNRESAPLSFSQQRLWFLNQFDPKSTVYNISRALRLKGELNLEALQQTLSTIVARHEVLRTMIVTVEGTPRQLVRASRPMELSMIDLNDWPESEREAHMHRWFNAESQRPFDLASDLMLRATLLRCAEEEHLLLLTTHHIASDGWSSGLLLQELAALYGAFCADQPCPLPELPIQYADFAAWQQNTLQGDALERQLVYWKRQLDGAPAILELPTDRPRPTVQSFQGDRQPVTLPAESTQALRGFSQRHGVTLFMTLLAALKTLLFRYARQADIVVGVPIANRTRPETEKLIGFFVNNLVLRTDLSGNPTFKELSQRIREVAFGAYSHQDLPFEKLVEQLHPDRDLSHSPLFQVMFGLQNVPRQPLAIPGLTVTPVETDNKTAKFDLFFSLIEEPDRLRGAIEYSTDLFDAETIARMWRHYRTLLEAVVRNPETRLSDLPLLGDDEKQQLLTDWNKTLTDHPEDKCIHQMFENQVHRSPHALAVTYEDEHWTYQELNQRANQLARYLQKLGVGPEALVGICIERSLEMVVGLLAILKAGGAYVPLDPAYPEERLAFMLEDAQVSIVITQSGLTQIAPREGLKVVFLDAIEDSIVGQSPENPALATAPDNLAYVIYTSGSTGKPKGVQIQHGGVVNFLNCMRRQPGLSRDDTLFSVTTLSFDIAGLEIFLPLVVGARVILVSREVAADGPQLLQTVQKHEATVMQSTPATWRMLLEAGWSGSQHLKILCGGEMLPRGLASQLLEKGAAVWNLYGPTETTIWSASHQVVSGVGPVSIGRPIDNTQIYILDTHLEPVPIGVPGELYIGGAGLARGYLNRPELTAERFVPSPFSGEPGARLYRTADLARYRRDGNLEFLGRTDHQVKVRGFRIELGEIESVLAKHPDIQQAVVTTQEDDRADRRLVAYLLPKQESVPPANELRSFIRAKLPDYMVPAFFVTLDALPLTPNGKVNPRALPAAEATHSQPMEGVVKPRNRLELDLLRIWEDVLSIKSIGVTDNFFDLGGHSLIAVRLFAQIEKKFEKKLPLATLFRAPTIEQLAVYLGQEESEPFWSSLVAIQPSGSKPPFFCVHAHGGNVLNFRDLARRLGTDQPFYGLQAQGLDGQQTRHTRIEEMAAHYLNEIKTVQPEGPYFLGGYCFGGRVAFEMAQQLHAQGKRVALLAMIDSYAPGYPKLRPWFDREVKQRFLYHWGNLKGTSAKEELDYVLQKGKILKNRLKTFANRRISWLYLTLGIALPPRLQPFQQPKRVRYNYARQTYPGRITMFSPVKGPAWVDHHPDMGWEGLAAEGLDIHEIPGSYAHIISEPFVGELADRLTACIDNARTEP